MALFYSKKMHEVQENKTNTLKVAYWKCGGNNLVGQISEIKVLVEQGIYEKRRSAARVVVYISQTSHINNLGSGTMISFLRCGSKQDTRVRSGPHMPSYTANGEDARYQGQPRASLTMRGLVKPSIKD